MIDLAKEDAILLRDFGSKLPRKTPYATVYRWYQQGIKFKRGPKNKQRVRLEAVRRPTGLCTTMEAYHRFIQKLSEVCE